MELSDFLNSGAGDRVERISGVVTGRVTNNADPDGLGRVRLTGNWLSEEEESEWARIAVPMGGAGRGIQFLPEVGDEVLIAFQQGEPQAPYVVGGLWTSEKPPPLDNADGKNNKRTIVSRSGHTIVLDDTDGEEKIEIVDKTKSNSIVISTKDNSLTIKADGDITIKAGKNVTVEAGGDLTLKATSQTVVKGSKIALN